MACMRACPQETPVSKTKSKVVIKEIPKFLLVCPYIKKKKGGGTYTTHIRTDGYYLHL